MSIFYIFGISFLTIILIGVTFELLFKDFNNDTNIDS